jgi:tRNA(adenine34) deaminase
MSKSTDKAFMRRAIELAVEGEAQGNVPVGAVIVLDGEIVGEGNSRLIEPTYHPGRHAEIEALRSVPDELWPRAAEMTCYSTLEPCVMCAGTLLLHGVGRVVFGAFDKLGGAGNTLKHLPPYYDEGGVYEWDGPLMPTECDPLYARADAIFAELPVGRASWEAPKPDTSPDACLSRLSAWRDNPSSGLRQARRDIEEYAKRNRADGEATALVLPYAKAVFATTTYLKDYKRLAKLCRRVGDFTPIEDLDDTIRDELPDVWVANALDRGDVSAALGCWFEHEEHRRIRHAADRMVRVAGSDDPELVVSARMSTIRYYIGRKKRRFYRRACTVLRRLRDELEEMGQGEYFDYVLEDVTAQYGHLRALADELRDAGFVD